MLDFTDIKGHIDLEKKVEDMEKHYLIETWETPDLMGFYRISWLLK